MQVSVFEGFGSFQVLDYVLWEDELIVVLFKLV